MKETKPAFAVIILLGFLLAAFPSSTPGHAQTLDEVYQKALTEGGTLNFYGTLAPNQASKILPVFEARFPGIKVNQTDATSDVLATRAITEARAGKTIADVFQASLETAIRIHEQGLLLEKLPPEAEAYPSNLKGSFWLAGEFDFIIAGWNTNLVKKQEEPKQFEDFAEPHWKGRIVAEPRDAELLIGLANHKFKSEDKAVALLKRIAANGVEFHKGHSQLAELLAGGQAAGLPDLLFAPLSRQNQKRRSARLPSFRGCRRDHRNRRVQERSASKHCLAVLPLGFQRRRTKGFLSRRSHAGPSESRPGGKDQAGKDLSNYRLGLQTVLEVRQVMEGNLQAEVAAQGSRPIPNPET